MLTPGFPGSEAETDCLPAVQNFVKAIARRNPDVAIHVVSFQYPFKAGIYSWNGVTVHALSGRNARFPRRLITWLRAALLSRRLTQSLNVVAIHSFWLAECTCVASWVARMTHVKHIASIRGQDALATNPYLKLLSLGKMTITAGSQKAADAFRENTGRFVDDVVPTGIVHTEIMTGADELQRTIDVLGVGSLSSLKDFSAFLRIVADLTTDYPLLKCQILGEGPERPSLEEQIKQSGLQSVVQLTGHVPRESVLQTMRGAKLLLHTSRYEGQGYVFLEGLAAGMRVVSFDVGYSGEGAGTYRCSSHEEIVSVLRTLLSIPYEHPKVRVDSIDETASAFEKLYGIAESR